MLIARVDEVTVRSSVPVSRSSGAIRSDRAAAGEPSEEGTRDAASGV